MSGGKYQGFGAVIKKPTNSHIAEWILGSKAEDDERERAQ